MKAFTRPFSVITDAAPGDTVLPLQLPPAPSHVAVTVHSQATHISHLALFRISSAIQGVRVDQGQMDDTGIGSRPVWRPLPLLGGSEGAASFKSRITCTRTMHLPVPHSALLCCVSSRSRGALRVVSRRPPLSLTCALPLSTAIS